MYIRVTKNQRGQAYYHLVESYRQDGKVKQRVLLSLGRVEENKLEELTEAINKHLETANIFNLAKEIVYFTRKPYHHFIPKAYHFDTRLMFIFH